MPGLFGIAGSNRQQDLSRLFGSVFGAACREFQSESLIDVNNTWALGRTHLGALQPDPQLHTDTLPLVLFHGDLYNLKEIAGRADAGVARDRGTAAAMVGALYRTVGLDFARLLDGAYCIAILDTSNRRLVLVTDSVGSYPIYWIEAGRSLVFGSEARAVLRHPGVRRTLDANAVADYLCFGMPLGDKTLAAGLRLLPAGSILVYDWDSGRVNVTRLTHIADMFGEWQGTRAEYFEALSHEFRRSVDRSLNGDQRFGLSLSGGLDSRAILSAVNGHAASLTTYTLGVKGCADEVIASKLARIAGTSHTFYELDDRYLREFVPNLARMVSLTDGMYLSHGLTEMLALGFLQEAAFDVLVRGHGGELAKTDLAWPLHTDAAARALSSGRDLVPYLFERINYISPHAQLRDLFTDEWVPKVDGAARESLKHAVADVPLGGADLCSYLYLTQHHRRCTIASLEVFREAVDIRLPFVDRQFLEVLFRGPAAWRADTTIHRALTESGDPSLLRVRNSNTGAPANAGPLVEKAFDKLNSVFKRLNVRGYRHYHNFAGWMREQLLSSVETVLLSRLSLDRGVLRETGVRHLLDETRANRADHSYLLQVLLILELWQQENL